jgi:hypothetical protein
MDLRESPEYGHLVLKSVKKGFVDIEIMIHNSA